MIFTPAQTTAVFRQLIGDRKAGFAFLQRGEEGAQAASRFKSDTALRTYLSEVSAKVLEADPTATERQHLRAVVSECRRLGQIPERALRTEFMALTERIGCGLLRSAPPATNGSAPGQR